MSSTPHITNQFGSFELIIDLLAPTIYHQAALLGNIDMAVEAFRNKIPFPSVNFTTKALVGPFVIKNCDQNHQNDKNDQHDNSSLTIPPPFTPVDLAMIYPCNYRLLTLFSLHGYKPVLSEHNLERKERLLKKQQVLQLLSLYRASLFQHNEGGFGIDGKDGDGGEIEKEGLIPSFNNINETNFDKIDPKKSFLNCQKTRQINLSHYKDLIDISHQLHSFYTNQYHTTPLDMSVNSFSTHKTQTSETELHPFQTPERLESSTANNATNQDIVMTLATPLTKDTIPVNMTTLTSPVTTATPNTTPINATASVSDEFEREHKVERESNQNETIPEIDCEFVEFSSVSYCDEDDDNTQHDCLSDDEDSYYYQPKNAKTGASGDQDCENWINGVEDGALEEGNFYNGYNMDIIDNKGVKGGYGDRNENNNNNNNNNGDFKSKLQKLFFPNLSTQYSSIGINNDQNGDEYDGNNSNKDENGDDIITADQYIELFDKLLSVTQSTQPTLIDLNTLPLPNRTLLLTAVTLMDQIYSSNEEYMANLLAKTITMRCLRLLEDVVHGKFELDGSDNDNDNDNDSDSKNGKKLNVQDEIMDIYQLQFHINKKYQNLFRKWEIITDLQGFIGDITSTDINGDTDNDE
jgi:hypothetical protein